MEIHERKVTIHQNSQATELTVELTTILNDRSKQSQTLSRIYKTDGDLAKKVDDFIQLFNEPASDEDAEQRVQEMLSE